jgi:aminopeptidase-like protein
MNKPKISQENGAEIYEFAERIFPICRSLTGVGVRTTLEMIRSIGVDLEICSVPSGQKVFDWEIPDEWNIEDAFIVSPEGEKIVDFKKNNLHVVGYSTPLDEELDLEKLLEHVHTLPHRPLAVPYVTSYYERRWGFCMTEEQKNNLRPGKYRAVIKSRLEPGVMNFGEVIIPGRTSEEVLLSTYVCHPSLANNEVSGPAVLAFIAKWLGESREIPRLTYRIVFVPETIGAIAYIHRNLQLLKDRVVAGINVTCVGDDRAYSYLPSRKGETFADRALVHVLSHIDSSYRRYSFLDRGSDERQYCSPGVDLPICSFMRSKYGEYDEYHTSDDDLNFISATGLGQSYSVLKRCIDIFERNVKLKAQVLCEPQLGKRGLYSTLGGQTDNKSVGKKLTDVFTYADGTVDTLGIAELVGLPFSETANLADKLMQYGLVKSCED